MLKFYMFSAKGLLGTLILSPNMARTAYLTIVCKVVSGEAMSCLIEGKESVVMWRRLDLPAETKLLAITVHDYVVLGDATCKQRMASEAPDSLETTDTQWH